MRRRDFITLLGGAAVAKPFAARAQEPSRIYRLGSLFGSQRTAPYHVAIFEALRQSGFVDGQNLLADPHGYGLRVDQVAAHAVEVVDARVDVILCTGDVAIRAAQQATKTIPILASTEDMVGSGFVHSLAKPDGNVTGVSSFTPELDGKRQEILLEAVPGIRRMAVLADANTTSSQRLQALKDAASTRAIELLVYPVRKPEEIASAIDAAKNSGAEALNVLATPLLFNNRQIILQRVSILRLPAIYQFPDIADEGGFIGYGPRLVPLFRDVYSRQLVALLRGAKVAQVPVEQPTTFDLFVNLKTANALGLTIPESFLARADKVIQ
jgi:putative tryptophan/tyrosine transport system substrate-binding protein